MRVLVIDNYDSFVYNLVQYLAQLGADAIVRRNDEVDLDELGAVDGVLVSPGPGTPERAGTSIALIQAAARRRCRCWGCASATRPSARPTARRRAGARAAARQDLSGAPRRRRRARRAARPVHRHPLPLADDPDPTPCPPSWRSRAAPRAA